MEGWMSRRSRARRSSRQLCLAAVGFVLVSSVLSVGPVAAHTFTKADGNDSPSKLDLRFAGVSHTATGVVHKVTTYNSWTSRSLGADSFFIIQIDKNDGPQGVYERCAFIFYTNRLRGSLTNCGAQFIRFLPVSKVSATTAKITIPKSQTGSVYKWAAGSLWVGPAPCGGRGCVDFAPNNFPDILHDMLPPVVTMTSDPLRVWEDSTSATFGFPFSVSDADVGIKTWTVQSHAIGSGSWTPVLSGTSGGAKTPDIAGLESTTLDYRVVATDKQGNRTIGPARRIYIPTDDFHLGPGTPGVFSGTPAPTTNPDAFGGNYSAMAASDVFTYTFAPTGSDCMFELIGPGEGDWSVSLVIDGGAPSTILAPGVGQRLTLYSDPNLLCEPRTYEFTVDSGSGFGVDAVLGNT
jgi:hypothetical protein